MHEPFGLDSHQWDRRSIGRLLLAAAAGGFGAIGISGATRSSTEPSTPKKDLFLLPESFGAVGDGSSDDTGALLHSFLQAATTKRPIMLTGHYLVGSVQVQADDLQVFWAPGAALVSKLSVTDDQPALQIIGSRVSLINPVITYTRLVSVDTDALRRPTNGHAVVLGGEGPRAVAADIRVIGGRIRSARSMGLRVRFARDFQAWHTVVADSLRAGISLDSCSDSGVFFCSSHGSGDDGVVVLATSKNYAAALSRDVNVIGCRIEDSYGNGINFTGVDGGIIESNTISNTWAPGIRLWQDRAFGMGPCVNIQLKPNIIRNAGRFYHAGGFKSRSMPIPHGVYIADGANAITLHPQTVIHPEGRDIVVRTGGVLRISSDAPVIQQAPGSFISVAAPDTAPAILPNGIVTFCPVRVDGFVTTKSLSTHIYDWRQTSALLVAIYADDGNGSPSLRLAQGTIARDSGSVGLKRAQVSSTLSPGHYWLAIAPNGGSPVLSCLAGRAFGVAGPEDPSASPNGYTQTTAGDQLPAQARITGTTERAVSITMGI